MSVIWEDPPPRSWHGDTGKQLDWPAIAAELSAHPGRWGRIRIAPTPGAARQTATAAPNRAAFKAAGQFEATSRDCRVYARYVGAAGSEATPKIVSGGPAATSPAAGPEPGSVSLDDLDAGCLPSFLEDPEPGRPCRLADWCVVTGPHDASWCAPSTSPEPTLADEVAAHQQRLRDRWRVRAAEPTKGGTE